MSHKWKNFLRQLCLLLLLVNCVLRKSKEETLNKLHELYNLQIATRVISAFNYNTDSEIMEICITSLTFCFPSNLFQFAHYFNLSQLKMNKKLVTNSDSFNYCLN